MLKKAYAAAAIAAVLFLTSEVAAQATKIVDLAEDPSATLLLENEYVRVWRVGLPRGGSTATHVHHRASLMAAMPCISSTSSEVWASTAHGHASGELPERAEATLLDSGPHQLRNIGCARSETVIDVEIKGLSLGPQRGGIAGSKLAFEGSGFAALYEGTPVISENQLQAGASTPMHEHRGPHLSIALADVEMRSDAPGSAPQTISASKGDVQWVPAGVKHKLTNVGDRPARWITMEFK